VSCRLQQRAAQRTPAGFSRKESSDALTVQPSDESA